MATDTDDNPDRQRAPRYAWVQPIAWETGTGLTGNMSTMGLFFRTDIPLLLTSLTFLLLGETFLLVGNTPPKKASKPYLHSQGQIVHIRPYEGQWGVGVCLTHVRYRLLLLRKRSLIETIHDQLKNISQIEHSHHRSIAHFMVNLVAGLIAYTHQPLKPSLNLTNQQLILLDKPI